jgi:hypothetical protein
MTGLTVPYCAGVMTTIKQSTGPYYELTCSVPWQTTLVPDFTTMPTLQDIFVVPAAQDLQTMWMAGFALPVVCYIVSWAYQSVINFLTGER